MKKHLQVLWAWKKWRASWMSKLQSPRHCAQQLPRTELQTLFFRVPSSSVSDGSMGPFKSHPYLSDIYDPGVTVPNSNRTNSQLTTKDPEEEQQCVTYQESCLGGTPILWRLTSGPSCRCHLEFQARYSMNEYKRWITSSSALTILFKILQPSPNFSVHTHPLARFPT